VKITIIVGLTALGFMLSGCAAIFEGVNQQITVNTNPGGASCVMRRPDTSGLLAQIAATPGSAKIRKTKYDITIECNKDGYENASYVNHSGVAGVAFVDAVGGVLTGGIAAGVDSATGADNKYDSVVNITLVPKLVNQVTATSVQRP